MRYLLTAALMCCTPLMVLAEDNVIEVIGTGTVVVKADAVRLQFGRRSTGPDYKIAKEENDKACKAILDGLAELKLPGLKITPMAVDASQADMSASAALRARLGGGGAVPVGPDIQHTITQVYTLVYRNTNPEQLKADGEKIFSTVIERGANTSSTNSRADRLASPFGSAVSDRTAGIVFFREDVADAEKEATKKAVANAITKAQTIHDALTGKTDVKVKVVSVSDVDVALPTRRRTFPGEYVDGVTVSDDSTEATITVTLKLICKY